MRKFLYGVLAAALLLLVIWYAVYYQGFYWNWDSDKEVEIPVTVRNRQLLVQNQNGEYEPFTVKGVTLSGSLPGHAGSDYAADEETYLRWLNQIAKMGANTVWVQNIMDDDFYNAFHRINSETEEPLYLLQGIGVSDYANFSAQDAYSSDFYHRLMRDSADAVDVIHGQKNITVNRLRGSGRYRKDISDWVLGYVVGVEWDPGIIAYTDREGGYPASYSGTYLKTTREATPFEAMLAKVMDHMVDYETSKYDTQRPISFINDPQNDPFEYEPIYGRQIAKYNHLNAEHIVASQECKAGYFASYRLYEFCGGFSNYFSTGQREELGEILSHLDKSRYYEGYTQLLSEYHKIPVLITGYGYSTARGLTNETQSGTGPLNEQQQGERLLETYQDIVDSGCAGAVISSWQDVWGQRTWNTTYAVDFSNYLSWHDLQTDGQGYGLMAFEPGDQSRVCYIDGDPSEWAQEDRVQEQNGASVYARYDSEGLYLLIQGERIDERPPYYLPIDVTPNSGSRRCTSPSLSFTRAADFLLCLEGRENSRLLVQQRYDSLRENYLLEAKGQDPFMTVPAIDSPDFVPIYMLLLPLEQVREKAVLEDRRFVSTYQVWETGRLHHGNGHPECPEYDSRSDYCYGDHCVEIRIPWGLLNFSDPTQQQIHDDYYINYGVENFPISSIWIGGTPSGQDKALQMDEYKLSGWKQVQTRERLKESYWILQQGWRWNGVQTSN